MTRPAFCDTETTSLDPEHGEIWEAALILPDGTAHHWFLPVDLEHADPIALSIGRFHVRHPSGNANDVIPDEDGDLIGTERFARRFCELTHGLHLAGAVVSFDTERLWRLCRAAGAMPSWHYHVLDVEALAAGWLAAKNGGSPLAGTDGATIDPAPPWDSGDLSRAVGADPADYDRHTALGDCRWAAAIYDAVMGTKETRPVPGPERTPAP